MEYIAIITLEDKKQIKAAFGSISKTAFFIGDYMDAHPSQKFTSAQIFEGPKLIAEMRIVR